MTCGIKNQVPDRLWQSPLAISSLKERLITKSSEPTTDNAVKTLRTIGQLNIKLTNVQKPIQQELQALLDRLQGKQFDSLEANRRIVDALRDFINRLQLRVECTRDNCGKPSVLLCKNVAGMKHGAFQFQHQHDGRPATHTASSTIPRLRLIQPATDRRRQSTKHRP